MTRKLRIAVLAAVSAFLIAALGAVAVYESTQHVPEFYRRSLTQDRPTQERASDQCLQRATELVSDFNKPGAWQTIFTEEQVNGWLAIDLERNYPDALPPEVSNPRVEIRRHEATLAFEYQKDGVSTVVTVTYNIYMVKPNVLAIRLHGASAGWMPLPMSKVLEAVSNVARNQSWYLEWRQVGGDPVAQITIPAARDERKIHTVLKSLELLPGETVVAGETLSSSEIAERSDTPDSRSF